MVIFCCRDFPYKMKLESIFHLLIAKLEEHPSIELPSPGSYKLHSQAIEPEQCFLFVLSLLHDKVNLETWKIELAKVVWR